MYEDIIQAFSVLGSERSNFKQKKFKALFVEKWETPSFSPVLLLPGEVLCKKDLEELEAYFLEHPFQNSGIKHTPYFNFINDERVYDKEEIRKLCREQDWIMEEIPLMVNFVKIPYRLNLNAGSHFSVYDAGRTGLPEEYKEVITECFHESEQYIQNIEETYLNKEFPSYTILLKTREGGIIGGGTVSIRRNRAFSTWGAVRKEYRNQNFYQNLSDAANMIAAGYGAHEYCYTTRNPYIKNKADKSYEMYICRKRKG